ncbi:hypothetical protein GCM10027019_25910 [Melaminivora jejuensis]
MLLIVRWWNEKENDEGSALASLTPALSRTRERGRKPAPAYSEAMWGRGGWLQGRSRAAHSPHDDTPQQLH